MESLNPEIVPIHSKNEYTTPNLVLVSLIKLQQGVVSFPERLVSKNRKVKLFNSKSCRRADPRLRQIFNNLRKMCNFERKIGKTGI